MGAGTPQWVNQVLSHSMDSAPETTQHLQAWRSGNRDVATGMGLGISSLPLSDPWSDCACPCDAPLQSHRLKHITTEHMASWLLPLPWAAGPPRC